MKYLLKVNAISEAGEADYGRVILDASDGKIWLTGYNADYIDLGLPSGLKWAKYNVGATSETDAGLYFAWGETEGYTTDQVGVDKQFSWSDYKYANGAYNKLTKYCNNSSYGNDGFTDTLTSLETSDDAATANAGAKWYMPSKADFEELFTNCDLSLMYQDGTEDTPTADSDFAANGYIDWSDSSKYSDTNEIVGMKFTSKTNGKTLVFPAAGNAFSGSLSGVGDCGYVWSASLYEGYPLCAWNLYFTSGRAGLHFSNRYYGLSVRGVLGGAQ